MSTRRSASVGALPREKKHFVSRNESSSGASLDVRCACQYFECDSLLPDRINPLDSRPSSKLGFHSDQEYVHEQMDHEIGSRRDQELFHPMNLDASMHVDGLSTRSFTDAGHHMQVDRLSLRSIGQQRSWDQSSAPVDLTFVEKYPELEETVRARGLVVRSISDATDGESNVAGSGTFMAGHRRRQMSVSGMSAGSAMRDPDTLSMRSVTSLRRISRSPSKADLFVADINIPKSRREVHEQRSASASRRTSNVDLSYFASHQVPTKTMLVEHIAPQQQQFQMQINAPQLNLIAPTPSPAITSMRPDFSRAGTPQISASFAEPTQDYRIAKPPVSADYMRPSQEVNTPTNYQSLEDEVLPQNRPIDMSKYGGLYEQTTKGREIALIGFEIKTRVGSRASSPAPKITQPIDPLQQKVAALEEFTASHNIVDIRDNIQMETYRPPSLAAEMNIAPLNLDQQTNIDIKSSLPLVDIDELVQSEERKAAEARNKTKAIKRHQSPPPSQPSPPAIMDTLQLPSARSPFRGSQSPTEAKLKRQHTPERSFTPEVSKSTTMQVLQRPMSSQTLTINDAIPDRSFTPEVSKSTAMQVLRRPMSSQTLTINGAIPLQEASLEAKSTYASRFKSMFTPKNTSESQRDASPSRQKEESQMRERSPSLAIRRSPSPAIRRSPSPAIKRSPSLAIKRSPSPTMTRSPSPSRVMTMFTKNKQTPIEIVTGTNVVISKKSEPEPLSVKVTETFSLKVDEMDQYSSRPPVKPPAPPPFTTPAQSIYGSREDFPGSDHVSADVSEAFAPVILPATNRMQFLAGNRTLYSSDIDMQSPRSMSDVRRTSGVSSTELGHQHSKGSLISVPINIGESNGFRTLPVSGRVRAPSEQRVIPSKLAHKSAFMEGRTQSQDRARIADSREDIYGSRMTKTVSFNFGERKSRLSDFENVNISQQQKEQRELLERTYYSRDHEYEPIGEPLTDQKPAAVKEPSPASQQALKQQHMPQEEMEIEDLRNEMKEAEELQKDMEDRYFSSVTTTPRTESRTDYEIHTSQVDTSALEELPLKPENRRKGFMASAQDRTRKMQAGIKTQAGRIKTKLRSPTKKPPSDSPKAKERKRFKAPEFSKMKIPEIKRPDMSKLKDFKRPEFTKFNKPDMSKFKLPEKFSTLKLRRSKSFKENEPVHDEVMTDETNTKPSANAEAVPQKKMFEFNFGTYPRAFRKNKKPVEQESSVFTGTGTGTEEPSVIPSTETQPSLESSSSPQGDRGPGPVRSRWADKFSDVSYNDSEGSRYRRYGSEQESFDRESSLERRMREDLEEAPSEEANLGILGGVTDTRQFAEFDEENRAIHEISNLRAGEFKRRPMVHQDSDLISEESKDAVGWTDKEIQKNKLLRKAELEAEASYFNYPLEERMTQDAQSTASSGKKVVMEEIDDDEFFLRKRGVSEDNIQLRQYISSAIREGFDMPINALQHVGQTSEPMDYGDYDVPPPKPRRLHKIYRPEDVSQEFEIHHSEFEDDISVSHNGSDFFSAPKRPMRKGRSRSKYSVDSQDVPLPEPLQHEQYFDDDEEYLRPPYIPNKTEVKETDDFATFQKGVEHEVDSEVIRPAAPRRRKRQLRESSLDKDSYINGFGGRSVSHSFLQTPENVIVYRTEHEYHIPLATPENYTDGTSATSRKSRSVSRYEEDDRTSRGADSFSMDQIMKIEQEAEAELKAENERTAAFVQEKFIIDMMENDGYAVVRKEHLPKPTPPARRKKFSRSPGERFATMPNMRTKRGSPVPPERPPPPRAYTPAEPITQLRESALSLEEPQNIEDEYEELQHLEDERPESPRNLQSGDIINKMKYRPLPPPPRPPREKRQRGPFGKGLTQDDEFDDDSNFDDRDGGGEKIASSSTADSYDQNGDFDDGPRFVEVEVSTQTDPLPDDFVCEEFEITADMKVIEPRKPAKTLEDMLAEERPLTEDEQLARGLQRFRDANQRSISEKSRASSKSQSRPQTPSAVVIERRVSTPIPNRETAESVLEAALIVRPIDDLDLEEEALRREGLLTDSSQQSKSDKDSRYQENEEIIASTVSLQPSSIELEEAIEGIKSQVESERDTEDDKEVERTMQEHSYEYPRIEEEILRRLQKLDEEEELKNKQKIIQTTESLQQVSVEKTPPTLYEEELRNEIREKPIKFVHEQKLANELFSLELQTPDETPQDQTPQEEPFKAPPQPPPRRRSSTTIEPAMLALSEQPQQLETAEPKFPIHMTIADLEVEHLRVHALQAGQIMVSQLHGKQISSDDLECKSGNLVVNNIELPSGFIEDIVERVRNSERSQLHAVETQTSRQASDEALSDEQSSPSAVQDTVPPPKPPRQRVVEAAGSSSLLSTPPPSGNLQQLSQRLHDFEEDTTNQSKQTLETPTTTPAPPIPNVFPTVEYLQSLAPLAFYNLRNLETDADISHRRRRHHRKSRESSPSQDDDVEQDDSGDINTTGQASKSYRHKTFSSTRPAEPQSVAQAGRQFLSACSLSLVNIINQLTESVRGKTATDLDSLTRERQVPTMVVLFIILTFVILVFLLSGKSVHTHHWDFFNPPGNNGRIS